MPAEGRDQLQVGERAPDFVARGPSGEAARFYAHAGGRPAAVVFTPTTTHRTHRTHPTHQAQQTPATQLTDTTGPTAGRRLAALASRLAGREDVVLCHVTTGPACAESSADESAADPATEVARWADPEGRVAAAYGVSGTQPVVVVLDPNLRVVGVVTGDNLVERVVDLLDAAAYRGPATQVTEASAHAPVLMVPGALPEAWCERLVGLWHSEGGVDTGVARGPTEVLDDQHKRRRDHTVRDPELIRELSSVVGRRVMPELRKAFAYRATRFEGFKIACYDAGTGGFFRPHRDNLTPATAHRAFALTLNLNDGYEGGQLRFPEYGNQLYRPSAGAALVFSCAHLHEVREVTGGRRFVLLSFLYGQPPPERHRTDATR